MPTLKLAIRAEAQRVAKAAKAESDKAFRLRRGARAGSFKHPGQGLSRAYKLLRPERAPPIAFVGGADGR
eukprot:4909382-Alexandrium_andersonii.AAC.1